MNCRPPRRWIPSDLVPFGHGSYRCTGRLVTTPLAPFATCLFSRSVSRPDNRLMDGLRKALRVFRLP
jgi:hypothetical protein